MSILKSAVLTGVWDERAIELQFHPDINFLIGSNGSGKTTAINLIAAMLTADYDSLLRIPFRQIVCKLESGDQEKRQFDVTVTRPAEAGPFADFRYVINSPEGSAEFDLGNPSHLRYLDSNQPRLSARYPHDRASAVLNDIVRLKWLSVHRTPSRTRSDERPSTESSVDKRLGYLSNQLVRYFSKLSAKREEETTRFLKQLFPILVISPSNEDPIQQAKHLDLPSLKDSVTDLFEQLELSGSKLISNLNAHFLLATTAAQKNSYATEELTALLGTLPMKRVVDSWRRSVQKQADIAQPRREFVEIINDMLRGKQININQRNELEAILPNDKHLQPSDLSSGEKQLLIIMSEALLQEKSEYIYIADEPELSLHVRWQEQLTRNLRKINPKAQVIFATHSPDIVSEFTDRVIDMEQL